MPDSDREHLVCQCGIVAIAAAAGERGSASCPSCGRPAAAMLIASQRQILSAESDILGVVCWPHV